MDTKKKRTVRESARDIAKGFLASDAEFDKLFLKVISPTTQNGKMDVETRLAMLLGFIDAGKINMSRFKETFLKLNGKPREEFIISYVNSIQKEKFFDFIKDALDMEQEGLVASLITNRWENFNKSEIEKIIVDRFEYPEILDAIASMNEKSTKR